MQTCFLPGTADHSREYVHLAGQNHQTADPWHYGGAHTSGQRQTEGLLSTQCPLWGTTDTFEFLNVAVVSDSVSFGYLCHQTRCDII